MTHIEYKFFFRYGDITPRTLLGRVLTITWLVIGMLLTGIVIGTIAGVVGGSDLETSLSLSGQKVCFVKAFLSVRNEPYPKSEARKLLLIDL